MEHRGEILEKAIRKSGMSIAHIARRLNRSTRWMYNQFQKNEISIDYFLEVGNIIHHDFGNEVTSLRLYREKYDSGMVNDGGSFFERGGEFYVSASKYIELLEKHNRLLESKLEDKKKNKGNGRRS